MTEEIKDDLRRVEFILNDKEMDFERSESKKLFEDLDSSPEAVLENPLNLLLSNFDNEYMNSERMGVVLFDILNDALRKYQRMINENYYYQDMEIIYVINDLIHRYNVWIANQRGLILRTRDLIRQIKDMIDKNYTTLKSLENFREEVKMQMQEEIKNSIKGTVEKCGEDYVIVKVKNSNLKNNDQLLIKKLNKNQ